MAVTRRLHRTNPNGHLRRLGRPAVTDSKTLVLQAQEHLHAVIEALMDLSPIPAALRPQLASIVQKAEMVERLFEQSIDRQFDEHV